MSALDDALKLAKRLRPIATEHSPDYVKAIITLADEYEEGWIPETYNGIHLITVEFEKGAICMMGIDLHDITGCTDAIKRWRVRR